MSEASGDPISASTRHESRRASVLGAADYLALAAAPTFLVMAALTKSGGGMAMICSDAWGSPWLAGMVPMYLLMSAFHLAPWLRLLARRGKLVRRRPGGGDPCV